MKWDKQMTRTQQEFDVHPIKLMEEIKKQETGKSNVFGKFGI